MSTTSDGPAVQRRTLVAAIADQHRTDRGALMPVLHEVMAELGWISRDDVATIAGVLNLSVADVHGVISFYHDFRTEPPPTHTVQLCRAEACQSVGAEPLYAEAQAGWDGTDVEVREVFCLGNCALGPAGLLDGRLHGRLDRGRLASLTAEWGGVRGVSP